MKLPQVTICTLGSPKYEQAHQRALDLSCKEIEFGAVKNIINPELTTLDKYSKAMLFDLWKYIDTEFALVCQADGYVLRPEKWTNKFLEYDYIGAPWTPKTHFTKEGKEVRVGNGGFSLRSRKLLTAFVDLNLRFTDNGTGYWHEDGNICVYYRKVLEDYGIKFAPVKLAARFSTEIKVSETVESFGGHKYL